MNAYYVLTREKNIMSNQNSTRNEVYRPETLIEKYGIKTAASESIRRVRIITPWPALTETDRSTHSWQNLVCFARNKLIGWSNPLLYIPSRCSSGDKASWGGFPAMLSHQ